MNSDHIVRSYDAELKQLRDNILYMGEVGTRQLNAIVETLSSGDRAQADRVVSDEREVDRLQSDVDRLTVQILAKRQPLAVDLRAIISAHRMAADLERITDYAANIARHALRLGAVRPAAVLSKITRMGEVARGMLTEIMQAYVREDAAAAIAAWQRDDEIDRIYEQLLDDLRGLITAAPDQVETGTSLMFVGRCCERIGDHITNLAEHVYFIATGRTYPPPNGEPA